MQSVLQVVKMEEHAMLPPPLLTVIVPVDLQVPTARIQVCLFGYAFEQIPLISDIGLYTYVPCKLSIIHSTCTQIACVCVRASVHV